MKIMMGFFGELYGLILLPFLKLIPNLGLFLEILTPILKPSDKVGGAEVRPSHYQDFSVCVQDAQLMDLPFSGCFYTWFNKQGATRIGSKLDRILVNIEWLDQFVNSKAEFLNPGVSGHSPGVATIFDKRKHGPLPFRFFNFLAEEADFLDLVRSVWTEKIRGNPMFVFTTKLNKVKAAIIAWKKMRFKNLSEQVFEAKKELEEVQKQIQVNPLCPHLAQKEKVVVRHYSKVARYEESEKHQKSRVQWLKLGDSNTSFFHYSIKERRSRNNISTLKSQNNILLEDDKEIAEECIDFFSKLYDEEGRKVTDGSGIESLKFDKIVDEASCVELTRPVSRDEIIEALSSIGSGKAPGPDGFTSLFFKVCWVVIGDDFVVAVQFFFLINPSS